MSYLKENGINGTYYTGLTKEDVEGFIKDLYKDKERVIRFATDKKGMMEVERQWFQRLGVEGEELEAKMKEIDEAAPEGIWYYDGYTWHKIKK